VARRLELRCLFAHDIASDISVPAKAAGEGERTLLVGSMRNSGISVIPSFSSVWTPSAAHRIKCHQKPASAGVRRTTRLPSLRLHSVRRSAELAKQLGSHRLT
jgi:hypothetical protein